LETTNWDGFLDAARAAGGDKMPNTIWENAKAGQMAKKLNDGKVHFVDLAMAYNAAYNKPKQEEAQIYLDERWRCLELFLEIDTKTEGKPVLEECWQKFAKFFAPFVEDQTNSTLEKLRGLCRYEWWYGRLAEPSNVLLAAKLNKERNQNKGSEMIKGVFNKKSPSFFLVRESSGTAQGEQFKAAKCTVSFLTHEKPAEVKEEKGKVGKMSVQQTGPQQGNVYISHVRVNFKHVDELIDYVNKNYVKNGFIASAVNRPYDGCFGERVQTNSGRYTIADGREPEEIDTKSYFDSSQANITFIY